jgi:hypothetical protein
MSWIKDNKFLVALGGGTLLIVFLLYFIGSKWAGNYEAAKADFDSAAGEAKTFESLPLYPTRENLDGKTKSLDDYRSAVESLQKAFAPYRPEELKNVSPEVFTNDLKAANDATRAAFEEAGTTVPDAYFCGFEDYKTSLAQGRATGILKYQLEGIKNLMLALAASGATELKNLHRPALPEERGQEFKPNPSQVARQLPVEITFQGPEESVRQFLSSIVKPDGKYLVVRSLRVTNTKKVPPRTADAKFEQPAAAATPAAADVFGGFVLPTEEAPPGDEEAPAGEAAEEAAPEPAAPADTSRILAQVLGNEEVQVFLRLDLMQFLPEKKLP